MLLFAVFVIRKCSAAPVKLSHSFADSLLRLTLAKSLGYFWHSYHIVLGKRLLVSQCQADFKAIRLELSNWPID